MRVCCAIALVGLTGCTGRVIVDDTGVAGDGGSTGEAPLPPLTSTSTPDPSTTLPPGSTSPEPEPPEPEPPEPVDPEPPEVEPPFVPCEGVREQSVFCLTQSSDGMEVIGLDDGSSCILGPALADIFDVTSLAWLGNEAIACIRDDGLGASLTRIDFATQQIDLAPTNCEAVADFRGRLVVFSPLRTAWMYASFEEAATGNFTEEWSINLSASRYGASDRTVVGSWHSTDTIEVFDVDTQSDAPSIPLEGHDDWVQGVDQVGNRLFIIAGITGDALLEFDATTGAFVAARPGLSSMHGLSCYPGG